MLQIQLDKISRHQSIFEFVTYTNQTTAFLFFKQQLQLQNQKSCYYKKRPFPSASE